MGGGRHPQRDLPRPAQEYPSTAGRDGDPGVSHRRSEGNRTTPLSGCVQRWNPLLRHERQRQPPAPHPVPRFRATEGTTGTAICCQSPQHRRMTDKPEKTSKATDITNFLTRGIPSNCPGRFNRCPIVYISSVAVKSGP